MTPIRPGLPQPLPAGAPSSSVANARAAFFQAMGTAQTAPVEPAAPIARTVTATAAPVQAAATGEPPARTLRPGSLLDIRV